VHRLQKLHAVVCGGSSATLEFGTIPIGDIIGLRKPIERRLREVRGKLRGAKRELCWGFAALREQGGRALAKVRAVVARDLGADLADALGHRAALERLVASWELGPQQRKAPVRGGGKRKTAGRKARGDHYHDSWVFD